MLASSADGRRGRPEARCYLGVTRPIGSGRQYQTDPVSSALVACAGRKRIEIRRQGVTSTSTS